MNDLQPVLDDENSDVDPIQLVKKLSGLNLTVSFDTWPARPTLFTVYSGNRKRASVNNPIWARLGTAQGKYRNSLVASDYNDGGHPRQFLYGLIAFALQHGVLGHLRRCRRAECRKFFVAEDLHRKYCAGMCARSAEKANALKRVAKSRLNSAWRVEKL
jgi:hypothetical protein